MSLACAQWELRMTAAREAELTAPRGCTKKNTTDLRTFATAFPSRQRRQFSSKNSAVGNDILDSSSLPQSVGTRKLGTKRTGPRRRKHAGVISLGKAKAMMLLDVLWTGVNETRKAACHNGMAHAAIHSLGSRRTPSRLTSVYESRPEI